MRQNTVLCGNGLKCRLQNLSVWKSLNFVIWERVNPFPNKTCFLFVCSTSLLKTLWKKEKLLVTSNFSFSYSVFYPLEEVSAIFIKFVIVVSKLFQFGRVLILSFGKELRDRSGNINLKNHALAKGG